MNMAQADMDEIRCIPLSYDSSDSQTSALRLILSIYPDWESDSSDDDNEGKVEFVRFTDGITNTVGTMRG